MMRLGRLGATGVGLLGLLIPVAGIAAGQGARPVPKLDMQQYVGTWFVIEQYPVKEQKGCLSDIRMLYTRGEGPRAFLTVTSCSIKGNNWDVWNEGGNADKSGNGKLKVRKPIWPFTTTYFILAAAPGYEWALVGSPNHKSLRVLSKTATIAPDTLAEIERQAAGQGYASAKLVKVAQQH